MAIKKKKRERERDKYPWACVQTAGKEMRL